MALNINQQVEKQIKEASHILIVFRKDYTVDGIASAVALYLFLKKINKMADIICQDFKQAKNLNFLPAIDKIRNGVANLQKFIISLDVTKNPLDEFSYDLENGKLNIYITPKEGIFNKDDISTSTSDYKYDLIFVIDSPDLESLGKIYDNNTEFFYNTTIINIDHNPQNDHFGQINLTNLNAVAAAEIIFELFMSFEQKPIDADIATCLLTGIIAKTRSFKTPNVTPKTLSIASELMSMEADRENIVKNLYRTRTVATLKLWGRVLARLHNDTNAKLVWSLLNSHDFIEAGATEEDLPDVIEELISTMPGTDIVALIYQMEAGKVCCLVQSLKDINVLYLTKQYNSWGSKNQARFILEDKTLPEVEKEVIETIKNNLSKT